MNCLYVSVVCIGLRCVYVKYYIMYDVCWFFILLSLSITLLICMVFPFDCSLAMNLFMINNKYHVNIVIEWVSTVWIVWIVRMYHTLFLFVCFCFLFVSFMWMTHLYKMSIFRMAFAVLEQQRVCFLLYISAYEYV